MWLTTCIVQPQSNQEFPKSTQCPSPVLWPAQLCRRAGPLCKGRAHLCSCNATTSHPGAKSTPPNTNSEGYRLSPSRWFFAPSTKVVLQCDTRLHKAQTSSSCSPWNLSFPAIFCTSSPLLDVHCCCCKRNEFLPLQPRLSATPLWIRAGYWHLVPGFTLH